MSDNLLQQWQTEGYIVVRNVFDGARTAQLRTICDDILAQWRACSPETGEPGGKPDAHVMRHLNHPGYFAAHPARRVDLLEAAGDARVLEIVRTILQDEPLFRCTSYFFEPLAGGRDGDWHRDSQFTKPDDADEQVMIADAGTISRSVQMQIALAPSDDIEYVPRSHLRWDTPEEYQIRKADGWKHNQSNEMPGAVRLSLDPGDAALFNPMGLHRGRYHEEKLRRTLMLTYTSSASKTSDYFSHQPWFLERGYLDGLQPATRRFYERFVELYRADWVAEPTDA